MESSIEEQVQTAADDSFRSDSVPSLPDEKGNFVYTYLMILFEVIVYHLFLMKKVTLSTHTCIIIYVGRLLEPFEILVTELINIIKTW